MGINENMDTYSNIKDNWRRTFGLILKNLFDIYGVSDKYFSEYSERILNYAITDSAVRKWFSGKRLPQNGSLHTIFRFFEGLNIEKDDKIENCVYSSIENFFGEQFSGELHRIRKKSKSVDEFIQSVLQYCVLKAKGNYISDIEQTTSSTGHTKAVVFDFDGTLTYGKTNKTTWESIWISLGYSINECQELQLKYIRDEISHEEWCQLTEDKFVAKHLHKEDVENIAKKIKLLPGVKETFSMLEKRNIKIYIVSGSIFDIIKKVLGSSVHYYLDGIKANQFFYSDNGTLSKIVGTKYDFEGKANFIREISDELKISAKDILFVGNSFNDRFAYQSGARTLCINPSETDPTDLEVWHGYIKNCTNLKQIMQYII